MPKEAAINISLEGKEEFTKFCEKKRIYQIKMMEVLIDLLKGDTTYGKLELDWKVIGEHFPKDEYGLHIRKIILDLITREGSIDFWGIYDHVQQTLGLEYSQAHINFIIEKCFCNGEVEVDSEGFLHGGEGKKRKARKGKGAKARWKVEWKEFCGTETVKQMRERLDS